MSAFGETRPTTQYPAFREAARWVVKMADGDFVPDTWLAATLREGLETAAYRFQLLSLTDTLLFDHGVGLVRQDTAEGKGYRVATDTDKVKVLAARQRNRIRRALVRQRVTLESVRDIAALDEGTRQAYERQIQQNAILQLADAYSRSRRLDAAVAAMRGLSAKGANSMDESPARLLPDEVDA